MATLTGDIIIGGGGDVALNTQIEVFTVAATPAANYTLAQAPALDATGDTVCSVVLNGWTAEQGRDYTVSGALLTWASPDVALSAGERLIVTYLPVLT